MALFGKLTAILDRCACALCVVLFMSILAVMVLQIGFRYALNAPLTWTEELARILYVWACYLGAPVALRRGNHVAILVVLERLPKAPGRLLTLGIQGLSLVFFLELAILGAILAARSHTVEAITLPIPWSVIYVAAPLSAGVMVLHTLEAGWRTLRGIGQEAQA
jgi:TRAP-type C4-dicarboxylate transport system permease small subunit